MKKEGVSTLFIHGFPWALSYSLDHFLLFENVFVWFFESILERRHRLGELCNDSRS